MKNERNPCLASRGAPCRAFYYQSLRLTEFLTQKFNNINHPIL